MADFMGLMKQAAQLQSKMQALQAELDLIEVEGTSGGGMVSVRLSAKGDLKGVAHRRFADEAVGKGNRRGPAGGGACRCAAQGGSRHAGEDEGPDRRPAAAAGDGFGVKFSVQCIRDACASRVPSTLVGEGQGGGSWMFGVPRQTATPTPDPSPQGGGDRTMPTAVAGPEIERLIQLWRGCPAWARARRGARRCISSRSANC